MSIPDASPRPVARLPRVTCDGQVVALRRTGRDVQFPTESGKVYDVDGGV